MERLVNPFLRRIARVSATAMFAVTLLAIGGPAVAECDGPVPSFRDALSTAKRIVIGDVIAVQGGGLLAPGADGRSSRFTLRVRYVLRGEAAGVMKIRDLPTQPCAGGVVARVGDRIALAFDAIDFTPPIRVNTVAWIRGTPPLGNETMAQPDVFKLLGKDPPDTAIATPELPAAPHIAPLPVLIAGLAGFVLGWRRAVAIVATSVQGA